MPPPPGKIKKVSTFLSPKSSAPFLCFKSEGRSSEALAAAVFTWCYYRISASAMAVSSWYPADYTEVEMKT